MTPKEMASVPLRGNEWKRPVHDGHRWTRERGGCRANPTRSVGPFRHDAQQALFRLCTFRGRQLVRAALRVRRLWRSRGFGATVTSPGLQKVFATRGGPATIRQQEPLRRRLRRMGMRRLVVAGVLSVIPLLIGSSSSAMFLPDPPSPGSRELWSWSCLSAHKRFIVPGMEGSSTAHEAAHFFPGKERAQIRRTAPREAIALATGVKGLGGPSRLQLYKLDGKWFVNQITVCERQASN